MIEIVYMREYRLSDQELISFFEMMSAPDQAEWDYEPAVFDRSDVPRELREFRQRPGQERNHGFWALDGNRVIAFAGAYQLPELSQRHCAELSFGVAKSFTRQGLGYRLVCAALAKAREIGLRRIEADCFSDNVAAIALLRKAGFHKEGVRVGATVKDGRIRDVRLLGLIL
jgi:RimJ/RimL family protein N-acetyltransferase